MSELKKGEWFLSGGNGVITVGEFGNSVPITYLRPDQRTQANSIVTRHNDSLESSRPVPLPAPPDAAQPSAGARLNAIIERLKSAGCLASCAACKGRGDRHVDSAAYSGQSTCPDCGGTGLHTIHLLRSLLSAFAAAQPVAGEAEPPSYYSVIRYVPETIRDEGVNIGIVLQFRNEPLRFHFTDDHSRAASIDNIKSRQVVSDIINASVRQMQKEFGSSALVDLSSSYCGGKVQIGEPRLTLTDNADSELAELFNQFVAASTPAIEPAENSLAPERVWITIKPAKRVSTMLLQADWDKTSDDAIPYQIERSTTIPASSDAVLAGAKQNIEIAAQTAFEACKAALESGNNYSPLQVAASTAAAVRKLMENVPLTASEEPLEYQTPLLAELAEAQKLYEQTTQGFWERDPNNASQIVVLRKRGETNIKDNIVFEDQKARNVDLEFAAAAHNLWPKLVASRVQPHSLTDCIARVAKVEELERGEKTDAN